MTIKHIEDDIVTLRQAYTHALVYYTQCTELMVAVLDEDAIDELLKQARVQGKNISELVARVHRECSKERSEYYASALSHVQATHTRLLESLATIKTRIMLRPTL